MGDPKEHALKILFEFQRSGSLPTALPPEILGAKLGDKKLEWAIHFMSHVIEDTDIRENDPATNKLMLAKLETLISESLSGYRID